MVFVLKCLAPNKDVPWIFLRDFNEISSQWEKLESHEWIFRHLRNFVEILHIFKLNIDYKGYTNM